MTQAAQKHREDFVRLAEKIFFSAVLGQIFVLSVVFSLSAGVYLWSASRAEKAKIIKNFQEWEPELTEAIYLNRITKAWPMSELPKIQKFSNALEINGIDASVSVASCSRSISGEKFPLRIGALELDECVFIQTKNTTLWWALISALVLGFFSLFMTSAVWFSLRGRLRTKILDPLLSSLERETRDATVGKMASQLAHDIRSPLAALNVFLRDAHSLPEEKRGLLRSAVLRIQDIANNLLPKNKTLISQQKPSVELLSSLVESLITEKRLQYRDLLNVEIQLKLDKGSYGAFAELTPSDFLRSLSNLIDNSVDSFSDKGGKVSIILKALPESVEIQVVDDGKGIPAEILPKLMEKGASFGKEGGSGLGLYFARETLIRLGGEIQIESKVGEGTTVTMRLQRKEAPVWFLERLVLTPGMRVAVIDDDTSIHQIWTGRFQSLQASSHDIQLSHFSGPSEIRAFMEKNPDAQFDCYLVDYEYAGREENGLAWILEEGLQDVSILVTSRFEEGPIKRKCEHAGIKLLPKILSPYIPVTISKRDSVLTAAVG